MENTAKTQNKLVERILNDARIAASEIEEKANAEIIALSAEAIKKRENIHRDNLSKTEAAVKGVIDGAMTRATIDGKKYALSLKRGLVSEAFESAYSALCSSDGPASSDLIGQMLRNEVNGGETVLPAAADRSLIEKLRSELDVDFTISAENAEIDRGFIIRSVGFDKDCSFRSILSDIRDSEETAVAQLLFD